MAEPQKDPAPVSLPVPLLPLIAMVLLLFAAPQSTFAQAVRTNAQALVVIDRLEHDPLYSGSERESQSLFEWIDKTDSVVVMIAQDHMNKIFARKASYARRLYVIMLGGMARYDLAHPAEIEDPTADVQAGLTCLCHGYQNILRIHEEKPDKYFDKLCREFLQAKRK